MAAEGTVIACHSVDAWRQQLQRANNSNKLVVVDFTASWCGPCRMIAPFFQEMAKKFTNVVFLKVDVDELESVAREWGVQAMPTFIYFKGGKAVDKIVGSNKANIPKKIQQHMR